MRSCLLWSESCLFTSEGESESRNKHVYRLQNECISNHVLCDYVSVGVFT